MCQEFHRIKKQFVGTTAFPSLEKFSNRGIIYKAASLDTTPADFVSIAANSRLYPLITDAGCSCVRCGVQGNVAIKHRRHPTDGNHHDVFALNERVFRLMTVDHILPKSWGGRNSAKNYDPMCERCNNRRGNTVSKTEASAIIANLDNHLSTSVKALRQFLELLTKWPALRNDVVQQLYACQDGHITSGVLYEISNIIGNARELFTANYTSDEMLATSIDLW
jgi:5-methylcytosine-specific restriction endonuclease McrA